jgi:hypothetical protein
MLAWHKYPDEKPPEEMFKGIIILMEKSDGLYIEALNYNDYLKKFYRKCLRWSNVYISDKNITHWIHINELPPPQQIGEMGNVLNWHSGEKDGDPKKSGQHIIYLEATKRKIDRRLTYYDVAHLPKSHPKRWKMLDVADYDLKTSEWEFWDRGDFETRSSITITHYIPLSEIPLPK